MKQKCDPLSLTKQKCDLLSLMFVRKYYVIYKEIILKTKVELATTHKKMTQLGSLPKGLDFCSLSDLLNTEEN